MFSGFGDSGGPVFIKEDEIGVSQFLGVINGQVQFQDHEPFNKNMTRILFSDYIANWVEDTINQNGGALPPLV